MTCPVCGTKDLDRACLCPERGRVCRPFGHVMGLCTGENSGRGYISYPPTRPGRSMMHCLSSWELELGKDGACECELAPLAWQRYKIYLEAQTAANAARAIEWPKQPPPPPSLWYLVSFLLLMAGLAVPCLIIIFGHVLARWQ